MDLPPPPVNSSNGGTELERRESTDSNFSLRPSYKQKFKPLVAKQIIQNILHQRLNDALYDKDQAPGWAREISQEIKQKLLGNRNGFESIQVYCQRIHHGEQIGRDKVLIHLKCLHMLKEPLLKEKLWCVSRIQCSCAWDRDTDSVAHETFKNDTIVCTIMAFGVYFY
ncbi:15617_t:CDS:2 [Funneliformis mosseae]|uniref:15617_t:CDS:1 n=1 Tax=Funneliformis mosseae TaxID=27381 RepID=A0A9N8Z1E0_FUNMO|nr:15617_t:CDS:2 [Funneliformis mosseae]